MEKALGGILRWGIPEYRLPNDTLDKVVGAIVDSGPITVKTGIKVGRDIGFEEIDKEYDAVFLGLGLTRSREIGIDNVYIKPAVRNFIEDELSKLKR